VIAGWYPISRASYQGVSPCAERRWAHSRRGGRTAATGPDGAHLAGRKKKVPHLQSPEVPDQERACAERIARDLAGRAYRRPITKEDFRRADALFTTPAMKGLAGFLTTGIRALGPLRFW